MRELKIVETDFVTMRILIETNAFFIGERVRFSIQCRLKYVD